MNARSAAVLLVVAALAGCGEPGDGPADRVDADTSPVPSPGPPGAEPPPAPVGVAEGAGIFPAEICDTIANSYRCAQAIEDVLLTHEPRVERLGDTLTLRLAAGDTLRLGDRPGESGGVRLFSLQDYWPEAGYFVVHEQHYEGSRFLLIHDSTGARTVVPDRPLPGPGGERFAVLSMDLVAGYGPNTVQIWSLGPDGPRLEWEHEPDDWGPEDGRWTGPETLTFTRGCGPREGPACGTTATVRRADGGWTLEPAGGPAANPAGEAAGG